MLRIPWKHQHPLHLWQRANNVFRLRRFPCRNATRSIYQLAPLFQRPNANPNKLESKSLQRDQYPTSQLVTLFDVRWKSATSKDKDHGSGSRSTPFLEAVSGSQSQSTQDSDILSVIPVGKDQEVQDLENCETVEQAIEFTFNKLENISQSEIASFWTTFHRLLRGQSHTKTRNQHLHIVWGHHLEQIIDHTLQNISSYDQRTLGEISYRLARVVGLLRTGRAAAMERPLRWGLENFLGRDKLHNKEGIFYKIALISVQNLPDAEPRNLADQAYAFAMVRFVPIFEDGKSFFDHIAEVSISQPKNFEAIDIAKILWAFAKVNQSNPGLFQRFGDSVLDLDSLDSFDSKSLSMILWAFATSRVHHPTLFQRVGDEITALASFHEFQPQTFSNIVGAFAKNGVVHTGLFHKIGDEIVAREDLHDFKPMELVNIVHSYSRLQISHPDLFQKVEDEILRTGILGSFNQVDFQIILFAYQKSASPACTLLFEKVGDQIIASQNLSKSTHNFLSNIVSTYSVAGVSHPDLFQRVGDEIASRDLISFGARNMAKTILAFSKAKVSHPDLFQKIANEMVSFEALDGFYPYALANVAWGYASAQVSRPDLFEKIAIAFVKWNDSNLFSPKVISDITWAFATSGQFDQALFDLCATIAVEKMEEFKSHEISNMLWAFSSVGLGGHHIFSFFDPANQE